MKSLLDTLIAVSVNMQQKIEISGYRSKHGDFICFEVKDGRDRNRICFTELEIKQSKESDDMVARGVFSRSQSLFVEKRRANNGEA